MVNRNHHRRAVVLIDVIVATIILGVALVAILGLTARAIDAQTRADQLRTAAMLIDERLNLVLAVGPEDYPSVFPTEGTCDAPFDNYHFEVDLDAPSAGDPYLVVATVTWNAAGRTRSESVSTMIAPRLGEEPDPIRAPAQPISRDF